MIYQKIIEDKNFIQIEKEIQLFIILQIIENDFTYRYFLPGSDLKWVKINIELDTAKKFISKQLFLSYEFRD